MNVRTNQSNEPRAHRRASVIFKDTAAGRQAGRQEGIVDMVGLYLPPIVLNALTEWMSKLNVDWTSEQANEAMRPIKGMANIWTAGVIN